MLAANFAGSFLNASGHLSQQKPIVLPSCWSTFAATTSLPLTGHLRLIGFAAAAAGVAAGGGASVSSSPRFTVTVGSDFFRFAAPSAVTFVCHRYRLFRFFIPDRFASPASVTAVPYRLRYSRFASPLRCASPASVTAVFSRCRRRRLVSAARLASPASVTFEPARFSSYTCVAIGASI